MTRKKRLLRAAILAQAAENDLEALSDQCQLGASPDLHKPVTSEGGHDRYHQCHHSAIWIELENLDNNWVAFCRLEKFVIAKEGG